MRVNYIRSPRVFPRTTLPVTCMLFLHLPTQRCHLRSHSLSLPRLALPLCPWVTFYLRVAFLPSPLSLSLHLPLTVQVGSATVPLARLLSEAGMRPAAIGPTGGGGSSGRLALWLPLMPPPGYVGSRRDAQGKPLPIGEVLLELMYKVSRRVPLDLLLAQLFCVPLSFCD